MKIPEPQHSIAALIDKAHEDQAEAPRGHLGCSILGHACDRYLWLQFRWAAPEKFPGRILRVFRRGQMEEDTIIKDLRSIGMHLTGTIDGKQARVDFGSHVSGSLDSIIENGVPESPKKKHVAEFKTHSLKSFNDVVKNGVEKSKPLHYVQMQLYMHGTGIDRALYYAICKDNDEIYTERVRYVKETAEKYMHRGHRITLSDRMPEPISADPSWYECKYCSAHDVCHDSKLTKQVHCRTCAMATPLSDSTWHCAKWDAIIPYKAQLDGCASHVLHPDLVPWQRQDSDAEWQAVYVIKGKPVKNGEPGDGVFGSKELISNLDACLSNDPYIMKMRSEWGGEIVG